MLKWRAAARTDAGCQRQRNEDNFWMSPDQRVFAVADGMGGHAAGEVASNVALDTIRASLQAGASIDSAINLANTAVREHAASNPDLSGMGTTLTLLSIVGLPTIGHVGDSRAYRLRAGTLDMLTDDHSLVAELMRAGRLTPEQAATHPRRSIITRALGADESINVDLVPVDIQEGDRLLLCSDGLPTMVSAEAIASVLGEPTDVTEVAQSLIHFANTAGGDDNITVIVADVLEVDSDLGWIPAPDGSGESGVGLDPLHPTLSADGFVADPTGSSPEDQLDYNEDLYVETHVIPEAFDDVVPPPESLHDSRGMRKRVMRILGFTLPLLIISAFVFGAVNWWAERSWYVQDANEQITLHHGIEGGFLWHDPTLVPTPKLKSADVLPQDLIRLRDPQSFGSKREALAFIEELRSGSTSPRVDTLGSSSSAESSSSIATDSSSSSLPLGP